MLFYTFVFRKFSEQPLAGIDKKKQKQYHNTKGNLKSSRKGAFLLEMC